jgi:pyruvate/2-oxoglutarate dehydrogenase complex dihydrolipoamide dehydrogenase (E3) component
LDKKDNRDPKMTEVKGKGIYNTVVIGGGTAGLVTAAGTAGLGGRVALIERHKMGGDCLNIGCVPSKALISSARAIERIRRAESFGLNTMEPQFTFEKVFERMRARRARIEPNDSVERFEGLGVDVFEGDASFKSPNEVEVNGQILRAKHFVIASGRRAGIPPIKGIDDVPYHTNETIFDNLKKKPKSIVIVGAGPVGCELGQVFNRLGVETTLVEFLPQIMGKEDADVVSFVQSRLESEGLRVMTDTGIQLAEKRDGCIYLEAGQKDNGGGSKTVSLSADVLLIAAGRVPNVEGLNLEAAGVDHTKQGVSVNAYLQTSARHIYAAGDIAGPYQFTHTADAQARVVVRNMMMPLQMLRQKATLSVVPWATYTDPEVAHVGLSERDAAEQDIAYDLYKQDLEDVDRNIVESEETGYAKVLTEKGSDKILGVTLIGAHAGDLLHEFVLAMNHDIGLGGIASTIHAYPTFAEIAKKLGDAYNRTRLTPRARSVFGWLYRKQRGA